MIAFLAGFVAGIAIGVVISAYLHYKDWQLFKSHDLTSERDWR
jgi:hypothetical protein